MMQLRNTEGLAEELGMRPLSARSVVASTLLGVSPPRLPVALLVRCGELFGISQGATRTAISRMLNAGELIQDERHGAYELAGRLLERQARQTESRRAAPLAWSGGWVQAVVIADRRSAAERSALREAAAALHLGELREGVWMRPDNLDPVRHPSAQRVLDEQCRSFQMAPLASGEAGVLAAQLWDLDTWQVTAERLWAQLDRLAPRLVAEDEAAIPEGFLVAAAVLRHLLADPILPIELVGDDWPGSGLRSTYDRYDIVFSAAWAGWFARQRGERSSAS